jgi:hypothetical protein
METGGIEPGRYEDGVDTLVGSPQAEDAGTWAHSADVFAATRFTLPS